MKAQSRCDIAFREILVDKVFNFLNIFTEHRKIIADYTKSTERSSKLLCTNAIVERL